MPHTHDVVIDGRIRYSLPHEHYNSFIRALDHQCTEKENHAGLIVDTDEDIAWLRRYYKQAIDKRDHDSASVLSKAIEEKLNQKKAQIGPMEPNEAENLHWRDAKMYTPVVINESGKPYQEGCFLGRDDDGNLLLEIMGSGGEVRHIEPVFVRPKTTEDEGVPDATQHASKLADDAGVDLTKVRFYGAQVDKRDVERYIKDRDKQGSEEGESDE